MPVVRTLEMGIVYSAVGHLQALSKIFFSRTALQVKHVQIMDMVNGRPGRANPAIIFAGEDVFGLDAIDMIYRPQPSLVC